MKTRTITLPLFEAIEACAAVLPHVGIDDVTPVICTAQISGRLIIATDRYTVGSFELSQELEDGASILLPLEAVKMIARIVTKNLIDDPRIVSPDTYTVVIEAPEPIIGGGDEGKAWRGNQAVTVKVISKLHGVELQRKFKPTYGNFPPVHRILDDHKPGIETPTVALGPIHLEKFTGYAKKYGRGSALKFTLGKTDNPAKPGPVLVTLGEHFTGLIQPNLMLR